MNSYYKNTDGFYLEVAYRSEGVNAHNYKKHSDFNLVEIIQIYAGDGVVLAGENVIKMESGAVYLINGDYFHSIQPQNPKVYIRNKIIIDSAILYSFLQFCGMPTVEEELKKSGAIFYTFDKNISNEIDGFFMQAATSLSQDFSFSTLNFTRLFAPLLHNIFNRNSGFVQTDNSLLKSVSDYVKANLDKKIVLDEMCRELFISKSYLCHSFKKQTNMTVNEYVFRCKISEAVKLLVYTDKTVTEIAMDTGFESPSHFCQVFKRYAALSPSTYRKKK